MPFEVFNRSATRAAEKPFVTIQKKGIFAFNHAAYVALGEPQAVQLLFDKANRVVGFRASDPDDPHVNAVRDNAKHTTHMVPGTAFTKHYGIPTDIARRWPARINGDGILTIDLKEPPSEVSRP
ncbi:MAG TPA: hypothetical protein VG245_06585 [Candidatus Dormibacteraeota bacterium]|jgi:hypothetical protein|nr:hypothetical protein [Candidatus Dormibacteraeota bacterium]